MVGKRAPQQRDRCASGVNQPVPRVDVAIPDIAGWACGNTGIPYVWRFDGPASGPHVTIQGVTHGNEVCGAIVLDWLLRRKVRPVRGTLTLASGSDGIDPQAQGFSLSLDSLRYNVPPGVFRGGTGRWRYRDSSGLGTTPKGITSVTVRRRANGTYRISVRGRGAELSSFDGTTDRTIVIGVTVGNDCASSSVNFRRVGTDLRSTS